MNSTRLYPCVQVETAPVPAVAQAGGITLTETIAVTGLGVALSSELGRWRKPLAVHDPAKVLLDMAITLALGVPAPTPTKGQTHNEAAGFA